MLKVHVFLDVSEKFSYCFSCETKDDGHFYYSQMWKVQVYQLRTVTATRVDTIRLGNVCGPCATILKKHSLMIPDYIPEVQFERFIRVFIFKKGGDNG